MNRRFLYLWIFLAILSLLPTHPLHAQSDTHPIIPANLSPITPTNAAQMQQVNQIGKGRIFGLSWMDHQIGVVTSIGAWVYDAANMTETSLPTAPIIPALIGQADAGAFSSDGRFYAVGRMNGDILLYDLTTLEPIATLQGHTGIVSQIIFSPTGQFLASNAQDGTVRVWDITTFAEVASFQKGGLYDSAPMIFTPNGLNFIWGLSEPYTAEVGGYTIHLWNSKTGEESVLLQYETVQSSIYLTDLAMSPDGQYLAVAALSDLYMWDVQHSTLLWQKESESSFGNFALAMSPDARWVVSTTTNFNGLGDGVRVYDRISGELSKVFDDYKGLVNHAAFSADGKLLAVSAFDGTLRVWDTATFTEQARVTGHYGATDHLALSPDGTTLAAGGFDYAVRMWDVATGSPLPILEASGFASVEGVAWHPDGSRLVAIANRSSSDYRVWDTSTSTEIKLEPHFGKIVFSAVFSQDGTTLWVAILEFSDAFVLNQISLDGGEVITQTLPTTAPTSALFTQDGRLLASGDESGTIQIWDTRPGKPILTMVQDGEVKGFAFSSDESLLASRGEDGRIWVWDVVTGELMAELPSADSGNIVSMAFSPDNQLLATGAKNGSIRILDIATQTELVLMTGHLNVVASLIFTPDGTALLSGSDDSTVRVWGVGQ